MSEDHSFEEMMSRLRSGDDEAASQVFNRFAERLIALARSRIDQATRQKIDPEDAVQSAYRSFFRRHAEGQFDIRDWNNLWTLLTVITVRKCLKKARYFRAGRRDVRQEAAKPADESSFSWEAISREPTPEEAALLAESVEQLLRGLSERDRAIVTLCLQGYAMQEISKQIGCSERTVQRVKERIREHLLQLRAAAEEES